MSSSRIFWSIEMLLINSRIMENLSFVCLPSGLTKLSQHRKSVDNYWAWRYIYMLSSLNQTRICFLICIQMLWQLRFTSAKFFCIKTRYNACYSYRILRNIEWWRKLWNLEVTSSSRAKTFLTLFGLVENNAFIVAHFGRWARKFFLLWRHNQSASLFSTTLGNS